MKTSFKNRKSENYKIENKSKKIDYLEYELQKAIRELKTLNYLKSKFSR